MRKYDSSGPEQRGHRTPVIQKGTLRLGLFKSVPCEIRDVSPGGARIVTPKGMELPEEFSIRFAQAKRARPCLRRWQSGRETGIEFI